MKYRFSPNLASLFFPRQRRLPRESDLVVSKRGEMYRFSRDLTPFLPFLDPVLTVLTDFQGI
jgi:hypothetical protein